MGKIHKILPKFLLSLSVISIFTAVGIFGKQAYHSWKVKNSADALAAEAIELNKAYTSPKILKTLDPKELGKKIVQNLKDSYGEEKVIAMIEGPALVSAYPIIGSTSPEDDAYWLRHDLNGKWTWEGTLFNDYNNNQDFSDWNNTIFGHRMKDTQMFGIFKYFENQEDFDKMQSEGKDIFTITSFQGKRSYKVAAVIMSQFYNREYFRIDEDREWLRKQLDNSIIDSHNKDEAMVSDQYLTLSTCTEASGPNRTILICYEIESAKRNLENNSVKAKENQIKIEKGDLDNGNIKKHRDIRIIGR